MGLQRQGNVRYLLSRSPKIGKLFEYIETAVERIIDEEDYYVNELKAIRENEFLISIL